MNNPTSPERPNLPLQPYKGARDFYPEDKRIQKYMFAKLRQAVEAYGYEEYDAPILEPLELYLAKSGEEIVNEQTYAFQDRGGRQVAIRPEMTPTVSRMVAARRQELAYPLRWYSIPNLWRYERPQRGRLREHWQLNVDMFGQDSLQAEVEMISVADSLLKSFGAKSRMYEIRVNSRELVDYMLRDFAGLDPVQAHTMAKLIDRKDKMDRSAFEMQVDALCAPAQREHGLVQIILSLLDARRVADLPDQISAHPAAQRLLELMNQLADAGLDNVHYDAGLMRGFDYYSGLVFEVFDTHPDNNRSMFGGGRYDGLVGMFGVEPISTIGFGMGDVTLQNFLETHDLLPEIQPETDVYVVLVGDVAGAAQRLIRGMRDNGLRVAVDLSGRKPDKQIKAAAKKGIHYVLFIGERELQEEIFVLRNITTGDEERHGMPRIISLIEDYRRR